MCCFPGASSVCGARARVLMRGPGPAPFHSPPATLPFTRHRHSVDGGPTHCLLKNNPKKPIKKTHLSSLPLLSACVLVSRGGRRAPCAGTACTARAWRGRRRGTRTGGRPRQRPSGPRWRSGAGRARRPAAGRPARPRLQGGAGSGFRGVGRASGPAGTPDGAPAGVGVSGSSNIIPQQQQSHIYRYIYIHVYIP